MSDRHLYIKNSHHCGRELYHHGILGQKWGVKNGPPYPLEGSGKSKVQRKVQRMAKKDAKEYARAKMYYGEGAGNRRKLIKATVEERSKDPAYKEQFEKFLAEQDMAEHATKAISERYIYDIKENAAKTARGIRHLWAAMYGDLHFTGADEKIVSLASSKIKDLYGTAAVKFGEYIAKRRYGRVKVVK